MSSTLSLLLNHPLVPNRNEPEQMEIYANDLTTNIIKDASKTASENYDEDNNELTNYQISKQTPLEGTLTVSEKFDQSSTHPDFDYDDIQQKMTDVIHDIRSRSGDETDFVQKSIVSDHLRRDSIHNSTPTIHPSTRKDSIEDNQNKDIIRSLSESAIVDHQQVTDQSLPIRQDESSSDSDDLYGIQTAPMNVSGHVDDYQSERENPINNRLDDDDDDEFFNTKMRTINDNYSSSTIIKQNNLDETTRFRPTSSASKPSIYTLHEESSASSKINSSNLLDDTHSNLEAEITSTRNLVDSMSLIVRARSSSPNDSQHTNRLLTPEKNSTRSSSTEQLFIPTNDFVNERVNSPPPTPSKAGLRSLVLFNPLLKDSFIDKEQDQTRSPSEVSRRSSAASRISNEKTIEGDIVSTQNRRESNDSENFSANIDSKSMNDHNDETMSQAEQLFNNREESNFEHQGELNDNQDHEVENQATTGINKVIISIDNVHQEDFIADQTILNQRQNDDLLQKSSSRKGSIVSESSVSNKRESINLDQKASDQQNRSHDEQTNVADLEHEASTIKQANHPIEQQKSSIHEIDNNLAKQSASRDRNSSTRHEPTLSTKHKRESASSIEKDIKHRISRQRCSEPSLKRNSRLSTDETTVTSIIMDSSKTRLQNRKHTSTTESDFERQKISTLPSVSSSSQREKLHHSETYNKQLIPPLSNRSNKKKYMSSSPSEDEPSARWIKHTSIPSIHFTDDELATSCNQESEKSKQKLERTSTAKKTNVTDRQHRPSQRSLSVHSSTHIPVADGKSLDSTSENNTNLSQRNIKTTTNSKQRQQSSSDEIDLTSQKPLKATKPMSEHLHPTRRHVSNQDKDPVNVNITLVVKKISDSENDRLTTAEAFVHQESSQYFESPQHSTVQNIEKLKKRSKSVEHHDRHTQSDSEQIITEKQKKHRRPKLISRTCQTYECIFRRMERERHQGLRAISAVEKNIQTRKSQVRSGNRSPKKYSSPYLSADSFKIEEMLRKQYYQSRRNLTKSSPLSRSMSPQGGKLLILRPTLPFHHTDAVSVQRICLQYAIDLVPQNTASTNRNKSATVKSENIKTNDVTFT
ncbi:hypothetical protein I4U23_006951 [Adineta vaga]|nr:hypothetical protein I4U23_006951 [Adineta vaga]